MDSEQPEISAKRSRLSSPVQVTSESVLGEGSGSPARKKLALDDAQASSNNQSTPATTTKHAVPDMEFDEEAALNEMETVGMSQYSTPSVSQNPTPTKPSKDNRKNWGRAKDKRNQGTWHNKKKGDEGEERDEKDEEGEGAGGSDKTRLPKYKSAILLG